MFDILQLDGFKKKLDYVVIISVGQSYSLKVMHYNIALLPKKVTNYILSYFLRKVMCYMTFEIRWD